VDWLVGSLEAANEARRGQPAFAAPTPFEAAAARALHRVLGSPGHASEVARPRGAATSDRESLVTDASAWRAYWHKARTRFAGRQKLRFGRPYSPSVTLEELEGDAPCPRAEAALELAIVTGGAAMIEPDDWVARQRTILAAARAQIDADDTYPPGTFPGARLFGAR
jgi:hypothetical protein